MKWRTPDQGGDTGQTRIRAACQDTIRSWLSAAPFFVDVETTGLDGEVIEIGVVDAEGRVVLDQRVRPTEAIHPAAQAVHGISESDLADAPRWPEIAARVRELLSDKVLIAYNAPFDAGRIAWTFERYGLAGVSAHWRDPMPLISEYLDGERDAPWWKLDDASRALGVRPGGHAASADAKALYEVVQRVAHA